MNIEAIIATIGCTEEQARALAAHIAATPKAEQGTWVTTERTIKRCAACGKRQWHDGDACVVCSK
jgi:hypothetical protein